MVEQERIAVAIGDPNGIGPEIAVKAAVAFAAAGAAPQLVLVGDPAVLHEYARRHAPGLRLTPFADAPSADAGKRLYYVPVDALDAHAFQPGKIDPAAGRATVAYVREAVRLAHAGVVSAVLGCPQSDNEINRAGNPISG